MIGKLRNDFDSIIFCYFSINLILITFAVANNRNTSIKDRANFALTTVQHNNHAMNILRLRLSSGINFIISCKGKPTLPRVGVGTGVSESTFDDF